jgi:hypothetical protein
VNIDQLLALVEDLSAFTTTEQLQRKLSQCRTAYDKLNSSRASAAQAEREKAKMLLAATARIQNKSQPSNSPRDARLNGLSRQLPPLLRSNSSQRPP